MGNVCAGPRVEAVEEQKHVPEHHDTMAEKITELCHHHPHLSDFNAENLGAQARIWLELLALPLPVSIALLVGGCLGNMVGFKHFCVLMIVFFGLAPVVYKHLMHKLGIKVKEYIELVDRDHLGVDIHIGELDVCLCYARVVVNDFQVDNPKGYKSQHFVKCKQIIIDVDMMELVMSKGSKVVVEEFTLVGIDAIIEYDSVILGAGKSNYDTIMEFMRNRGKKTSDAKHAPDKPKKKPDVEPTEDDAAQDTKEKKNTKKKGRQYELHKVAIVDVGARVQSSIGIGPRVGVADIKYAHFTKQFKPDNLTDIVGILLKSLVKSVVANVGGKAMSDKML